MSEAIPVDLSRLVWRKSSHSGDGVNSACIEVGFIGPIAAVRDSKNPAAGALAFPATAWSSFLRYGS